MLRKIRVILGAVFFALITLLFLDISGALHGWFGWLAKIQLVPAILAVNFIVVVALVVLTLLLGRVYCSVICPLGVFQDGASWTAGRFRKKNRFGYSPAVKWLRYTMLGVFVIALVAHVSWIVVILEPYSTYGRIASNLFAPLYGLGNNLLAFIAGRVDSYAFYSTEVWVKSWITFGVALLTFLGIGYLAWRNGRTWCNTVCPVGTVLGFLSKFSLFKPVIDPAKCTKCSLCSKNCKASCIDYKNYEIDHSRCVTCMNCLDKCKFDALHYTMRRPVKETAVSGAEQTKKAGSEEAAQVKVGPVAGDAAAADNKGFTRRSFLSITAFFAVSNTLKAQAPVVDGGLAIIEDKKVPNRETPIVPPGSQGAKHMKIHCTACQLCVSACPNNILRPSEKLATFMQPEMSFERGYCRPECTRCSEVCPNDAIKKITPAEKSAIQIGRAVWIKENCIVNRDEEVCTACERHCPTNAIELIPRGENDPKGLKIPVINTELCIGCGACENLCPSRPFSAIYVEGITRHRTV